MEYENNQRRFESVYSTKVRAGKRRTYFFDVRKTKGDDFYITLTESTKRFDSDGYERHKIFLYKEDFNRFLTSLGDAINHVKTELMPDYDYDEFTRRQEEWEIKRAAMDQEDAAAAAAASTAPKPAAEADAVTADTHAEAEKEEAPTDVPAAMATEEVSASMDADEDMTPSTNSEGAAPTHVSEEAPASVVSEKASPSAVSGEVNETSAETDEEDMSW